MNKAVKFLLWFFGIIAVLALLFVFVIGPIMKKQTKKASPEQNITYTNADLQIDLFYCSPSKKDRVIFGELVPYGEVWRTGANEASTFTTNQNILINGEELPAGAYTLWTIPDVSKWQVIFNSKMYGWGVKITDQKAARDPDFDVVNVEAKVAKSYTTTENFSMNISETEQDVIMTIAWDDVVVPLTIDQKQ